MKFLLILELDVDEKVYGTDQDEVDWLCNDILLGDGGLILHSNEIGDEVGIVTVLDVNVLKLKEDEKNG